MRKYLLLIIVLILISLTGCSKNNTTNSGQRIIYTTTNSVVDPNLSVPFDSLNMIIGDEYFINPSYNKIKGFSLSYESSNTNVTVSELGVIKAIKQGSTQVKIKYSNGLVEYSKEFTVNISFGDYVPILKLSTNNDLVLEKDDEYNLNPLIDFRNTIYHDAKYTFESLDESICTITSSGVVKAISNGNARILINATWRGKNSSSYPSLSSYIDLEVVDSVRFLNGSNAMSDINLYTISSLDGINYDTTYNLDFKVIINGIKESASYRILDDSIVNLTGNTITSNIPGSTTIELYKEINGKTYISSYKLNVLRPIKMVEDIIPMFSILDGKYYDKSSDTKKSLNEYLEDESNIVSAIEGNNALEVVDNNVYGVLSSSQVKRGIASITLSTQQIEYHLTLETITKVISSKEDLKCFEIKDKDINGYFELAHNIDAEGLEIKQNSSTNYFTGIFNGCGYSIYNLNITNSSLFGSLYNSVKLMNFALINLNASNTNYFASKASGDSITVENVYIELSEDTINPRGMFITSPANNTIKNVVIVYLGANANSVPDYSLGGWTNQSLLTSNQYYNRTSNPTTQTKKWSDVICISPYALGFRPYETVLRDEGDKTNFAVYYYGINETIDHYNNPIKNGHNIRPMESINCESETYYDIVYEEVYHFSSLSELATYSYDYSSFSSEYWTISGGIITWNN